jgi:hypothetical protein
MIERASDWETRLHDYLASMANAKHVYGETDCALFASGAVLAMTDYDPAAEFRGKYKTELGAARVLRKIGNGDLESTFDAKFPEMGVAFARRGDIVWDGQNAGICFGAFGFFMGAEDIDDGLVRLPRAAFVKAWRVGE